MFVFESTLNRRVDERYNGIIYITINSKIAMIYLGMGIDESKKEEERKRNATRALPNKILRKIVRAVYQLSPEKNLPKSSL